MDRFFKKYPYELGGYQAIMMVKEKLQEACKAEDQGSPNEHYLLEAYEMLSDLLEIKGLLGYDNEEPQGQQGTEADEYRGQYARGSRGVGGNFYARGNRRTR